MKKKNKNKQISIRLFLASSVGLFLLSACGKTAAENKVDESVPAEFDAMDSDFEYQFVAESEDGYYFWEHMGEDQYYPRLMFLDKVSDRVVPLCNKPDCMHDTKECNAYFPNLNFGEDGIDKHYLQYYEGSLYAVGVSSENYVTLFRIAADGSEWEISTALYRADYADTGHWRTLDILIDNGYVYYVDTKQKKMKLERMPIGGGTAEVLFEEEDGAEVEIYRMECHENDNRVFFQAKIFLDESAEHTVGGLYQYNEENGCCDLIKGSLSSPYTVLNGEVYYGNTEGLCRYSIQDGITEVLDDQPMDVPNITLTEDYIILCNHMVDGSLLIYDYEGNQIAIVSDDMKPIWYFGGSSEMLFSECVSDNRVKLCYLDLTRPLDELEWEELKVN